MLDWIFELFLLVFGSQPLALDGQDTGELPEPEPNLGGTMISDG